MTYAAIVQGFDGLMNGVKVKLVQIDQQKAGQRIDNFLLGYFANVPKSRVYRALRSGEVRVNKRRVKPVYRLQIGDQIRIPPLRQNFSAKPLHIPKAQCERLENCILKEDQYLLVLNKPAGLAVHAGTGDAYGVIEILRASREHQPYLELAHRIDKETSGCLILAKTRRSLLDIQQSLQSDTSIKNYICLVKGLWQVSGYDVRHNIQKNGHENTSGKMKVSSTGLAAHTTFSTIETFANSTLLKVQIHTGRTHQIRIHAQAEHHPIAGDPRYGDFDYNHELQKMGLRRMFLHASQLRLRLTDLSQNYEIHAPLPEELKQLCQRLKNKSDH